MPAGTDSRGCAVFDVDGTLLDTNYLHVAAWWEAFREGGPDICSADVHRALGKDSTALVQAVIGRSDEAAPSPAAAPAGKEMSMSHGPVQK